MDFLSCFLCLFCVAIGFMNIVSAEEGNQQYQHEPYRPLKEEQLISSGLNCKCLLKCCRSVVHFNLTFSFSFQPGTCPQVLAQYCFPFSLAVVHTSYFKSYTTVGYLFNHSWLLTLDSCFHGLVCKKFYFC